MLDLRHVVDHLDEVRAALGRRGPAAAEALAPIASLSARRREAILAVEKKQAERNTHNDAMAKADKKSAEFAERRDALKALSGEIKDLEKAREAIDAEIQTLLAGVPNIPDASVPDGTSEADNVVVREWGEEKKYDFTPKPHWELGTNLGILDFERAAKLSGARFTVLFGAAARSSALSPHARPAHAGSRVHRGAAAVPFKGSPPWHRQLPRSRSLFKTTSPTDALRIT